MLNDHKEFINYKMKLKFFKKTENLFFENFHTLNRLFVKALATCFEIKKKMI